MKNASIKFILFLNQLHFILSEVKFPHIYFHVFLSVFLQFSCYCTSPTEPLMDTTKTISKNLTLQTVINHNFPLFVSLVPCKLQLVSGADVIPYNEDVGHKVLRACCCRQSAIDLNERDPIVGCVKLVHCGAWCAFDIVAHLGFRGSLHLKRAS